MNTKDIIQDNEVKDTPKDPYNDRSIIDIIKSNIITGKQLNSDIHDILRGQIEFMKIEKINKNSIIENLLLELYKIKRSPLYESVRDDE